MIGKTNSKQAAGNAAQEFVNVQLSTNQSSHGDLAGAKVTVSYGTYTKEYTWSGREITFTIPAYINYTVTFGSVEGYKTPASVSHSAIEDNARTIEAVYQCELVKVSVSADDGSSVNGAVVTINGKSHTWNGKVVEQKVPFGTSYSVSVGDFSGYIKPSSKSYTANSVSREVSMVYAASSLVVNILSNQGTDAAISGVQATVKYGSTSVNVVSGQRLNIPSGSAVTITFPEVDGYLKPEDISFTHSGGAVTKSGEYKCELLTVNVSADEGVPTGFEVTISKKEVLGANGEYTRLEYIESAGTQWIDTGFKPNNNTRVVMDAYISSNSSTFAFFGGRTSFASNDFSMWCDGGKWRCNYNNDSSVSSSSASIGRITIDKNKNITTIGSFSLTQTYASFQASSNLCLFATKEDSEIDSRRLSGKLYSCQIYDNGILIRDYIPALRSDGVVGLLDSISGVLYTNSGSGSFVAGSIMQDIIATQTSTTGSYKIPFGETYSVEASNVSGFKKPSSINRTSSENIYIANMRYTIATEIDLSLQDVYGNPINRSTANCYVVREPGTYKFPLVYGNAIKNGKVNTAAFTNNGGSYSHNFVNSSGEVITSPNISYTGSFTASILNTDHEGLISEISSIQEGDYKFIQFKVNDVPSSGANYIISMMTGIVQQWSWHIWLWPHDLSPVEITNATGVKYNIMPVNLASKYDSDGVHIKNWFYQWGRKDPLALPATYNSTSNGASITLYQKATTNTSPLSSIQYPTIFYYNNTSPYNWFGDKSYYNLWDAACTGTGASDNDTVKTVYDPCPVGWKVPNGNTFTGLSVLSSADGIVKMSRYSGDTVGVEFPLSGYRLYSNGSINNAGSYGYVWLSSAYSSYYACQTYFWQTNVVSPDSYGRRAYGLSIRPVQDNITKIDTI